MVRKAARRSQVCTCEEQLDRAIEQARGLAEVLLDVSSHGLGLKNYPGLEPALARTLICLADLAFLARDVKARAGRQIPELLALIPSLLRNSGTRNRRKP